MADKLKGKPGFAGWRHAVWVLIMLMLPLVFIGVVWGLLLFGKSHRFLGDHFAG